MSIQIQTFKPADAKIKALVYGQSGIGKTTFGATAPKPLFISAESGLLSVADKNIQYVEIKSIADLQEVYQLLKKGGHGFETVVIDSLTEIQSFIISKITGGVRMPQKGEWSDFGFEMTKVLRAYRDLPMHVIFLALETEKEEDDEGKTRCMPDLYGKVRTAGAGFMDFVGRMGHYTVMEGDKKIVKRSLCFVSNERFIAKDRSGKLPKLVDPDFTEMLKMAGTIAIRDKGGLTPEEDAEVFSVSNPASNNAQISAPITAPQTPTSSDSTQQDPQPAPAEVKKVPDKPLFTPVTVDSAPAEDESSPAFAIDITEIARLCKETNTDHAKMFAHYKVQHAIPTKGQAQIMLKVLRDRLDKQIGEAAEVNP